MKIRTGFVSNSSSSSFIVAYKSPEETKVKVTLEIDLNDFAETYIRSPKDVDRFMEDYWNDEDLKEKLLESLKEGRKIMVGEVGNCTPNIAEEYLFRNGLPENLKCKVIEGVSD